MKLVFKTPLSVPLSQLKEIQETDYFDASLFDDMQYLSLCEASIKAGRSPIVDFGSGHEHSDFLHNYLGEMGNFVALGDLSYIWHDLDGLRRATSYLTPHKLVSLKDYTKGVLMLEKLLDMDLDTNLGVCDIQSMADFIHLRDSGLLGRLSDDAIVLTELPVMQGISNIRLVDGSMLPPEQFKQIALSAKNNPLIVKNCKVMKKFANSEEVTTEDYL